MKESSGDATQKPLHPTEDVIESHKNIPSKDTEKINNFEENNNNNLLKTNNNSDNVDSEEDLQEGIYVSKKYAKIIEASEVSLISYLLYEKEIKEVNESVVEEHKIQYNVLMKKIEKLFICESLPKQYPTILIERLYSLPSSIPQEPDEFRDFNMALSLLVKSFKCEVYIYNTAKELEVKLTEKNNKTLYRLFCMYDRGIWKVLRPKKEALYGNMEELAMDANELISVLLDEAAI